MVPLVLFSLVALLFIALKAKKYAALTPAPPFSLVSWTRVQVPADPSLEGWIASNASTFVHDDVHYLLVRYVNYFLFKDLRRRQTGPGRTINVLCEMDSPTHVKQARRVAVETSLEEPPNRISYGLEDARVAVHNGQCIVVAATVGYGHDRVKSEVIQGILDTQLATIRNLHLLDSPAPGKQQKNWIPFDAGDGTLRVVQYWNPPLVAKLDAETGALEKENPGPKVSQDTIFGSSNLIPCKRANRFDASFLALVHNTRLQRGMKRYAHAIAFVDKNGTIAALTPWFSFQGELVEFCTGIRWHDEERQLLGAYVSVYDRDLSYAVVPLTSVEFFPVVK